MTITKTDDGYAVNLKNSRATDGGNDLIDLVIEANAITAGHFFAQGYKVDVTGTFTDGTFDGQIDAEGNVFEMTAVKQN